jgi:membrane-associated phospholipid phosphatase
MFSRVYIGVHYPLDVLVGAAIGVLVGLGCLKFIKRIV